MNHKLILERNPFDSDSDEEPITHRTSINHSENASNSAASPVFQARQPAAHTQKTESPLKAESPPTQQRSTPALPEKTKLDNTDREAQKIAQAMAAFARAEQSEKRKKDRQKRQEDILSKDPCTCGHARSKSCKPSRPLSFGGPRCIRCESQQAASASQSPELSEAPTFYPSEEEFRNPMQYIRKVGKEAEHFGIFKIQPPASWKPGCRVNLNPNTDFQQRMAQFEDSEDNDTAEFWGKLQTVKSRSKQPERASSQSQSSFPVEFKPRYERFTWSKMKKLDQSFRNAVFPGASSSGPSPEEVESWFWSGLASQDNAHIVYCSDVEGTAFPLEGQAGCDSPWNLQNIRQLQESLLSYVKYIIPGVTDSMLYIGMVFAMFCWHNEDNYMNSISYLHQGAKKTWYGIAPTNAYRFEQIVRDHALSDLVKIDPELLYKKMMMVPPSLLVSKGLPVTHLVQEPGQFVVTLPQAYHCGFSHGFNLAEAVNFMLPDWIPFGLSALERYAHFHRESVLDMEQMLWDAAADSHQNSYTVQALKKLVDAETVMRSQVRAASCVEVPLSQGACDLNLSRGVACDTCKKICYFSFIACRQCSFPGEEQLADEALQMAFLRRPKGSGGHVSCVHHAASTCSCDLSSRCLFIRHNDEQLRESVAYVEEATFKDVTNFCQQPSESDPVLQDWPVAAPLKSIYKPAPKHSSAKPAAPAKQGPAVKQSQQKKQPSQPSSQPSQQAAKHKAAKPNLKVAGETVPVAASTVALKKQKKKPKKEEWDDSEWKMVEESQAQSAMTREERKLQAIMKRINAVCS